MMLEQLTQRQINSQVAGLSPFNIEAYLPDVLSKMDEAQFQAILRVVRLEISRRYPDSYAAAAGANHESATGG